MPTPTLHPFAWHGFPLLLPEDWNLIRFQGTASRGMLLFADLRQPRLILRWKRPPRFSRRLPTPKTTPSLALLRDSRRLIELEAPTPTPDFESIATALSASLQQLENAPLWPWQLYGIDGVAPAWARLTKASLLPGHAQLTLTQGPTQTTLGAFALADRLLKNQTLQQWAATHLPLPKIPGTWQTDGPLLTWTSPPVRHLLRRVSHRLTVTHLPELNRIRWTHTREPAKTP